MLFQNPKKIKKIHKKNKKTHDQPIVGLSEIFYPDFVDNSQHDFNQEESAQDFTAQYVQNGRMMNQPKSFVDYNDQSLLISSGGRGTKPKKTTSSRK